jgi:hypothetical protein
MSSNLLISIPDIPRRAITRSSLNAYADLHGLKNVTQGRRHNIAKLSTGKTQEWVQYDMGPGNTASANHLIIARADMLKHSGCTGVTLTGCDASIHAPLEVTTQPTVWRDFSDDAVITQSATRTISAVANKGTASAPLVQATEAAKFRRTRSDNRENGVRYSEDVSQVSGTDLWRYFRATNISATEFKEDASTGTHGVWQTTIPYFGPVPVVMTFKVKRGTGTRNLNVQTAVANTSFNLNLANGTAYGVGAACTVTVSAIDAEGYYTVTHSYTRDTTAAPSILWYIIKSDGTTSWAGDDASSLHITEVHYRTALADSTYIATTTYPQIRGVNGRAVAYASGAQYMTSTATTAQLFSASAKTVMAVVRIGDVSANRDIMRDVSAYWVLQALSSGQWQFINYDGTSDYARQTATANELAIITARHESGNIYIAKNGTESDAVASGDTPNLTKTQIVGAANSTQNFFLGHICEILTWDVALSAADRAAVYAYLAAKYSTAPAYQNLDFANTTLYGIDDADLIATFTATTAYRYWWLEYSAAAACTFPRSKESFGLWFDMLVHPSGFSYRPKATPEKTRTPFGYSLMSRSLNEAYTFEVEFGGVTDAVAASALDSLCDEYSKRAFLYTPTNLEILGDTELSHVAIEPGSVAVTRRYTNNNVVRMTFKQERG